MIRLTPKELDVLNALDKLTSALDLSSRLEADPIRFPRRFDDPLDIEVISLFTALLSYGRASQIGIAVEDVLGRLGPTPALSAREDAELRILKKTFPSRFEGFKYRFTEGADLDRLWFGVGSVLAQHGSLGAVIRGALKESDDTLIPAYTALHRELLSATRSHSGGKGFQHLLSDPSRGSALKRVNMWLRWMVRGPDEIDFGLWSDLNSSRLLIPLDVHVSRLSRALGMTQRKANDLKTALEVSAFLKRLDPHDPIRFDFALAHLGISGACVGYRVHEICEACPLTSLCTLQPKSRSRNG